MRKIVAFSGCFFLCCLLLMLFFLLFFGSNFRSCHALRLSSHYLSLSLSHMCWFSKLLLFSFFFCKDGSDRLMKRASYSCCNFLCVVLAAIYLKYCQYRLSCFPFVWHFFSLWHTHLIFSVYSSTYSGAEGSPGRQGAARQRKVNNTNLLTLAFWDFVWLERSGT